MANPVALDLSAAKTLFAFGERAAKHGLVIPGDLQQFIDEPDKMARLVDYAKSGAPLCQVAVASEVSDIFWPEVYNALGMGLEYTEAVKNLAVSSNPNPWVIPVIKGVTCNRVVEVLRNLNVNVYTYVDDLDKSVTKNDRDPKKDGSYTIAFRRTVEADEENKNLSANTLKKRNHKGITLLERLLLELGYFLATGRHLDVSNWTLCTGSRFSVGHVPFVYWSSDGRGVSVGWCNPDNSDVSLRSRSVVSLPS